MKPDNIILILSYLGITVRREGDQIFVKRPGGWTPELADDVRFCRASIAAELDRGLQPVHVQKASQ
ncbi:MAG: hypothetical protein B7X48_08845 [Acidiphilium sp. 34-60-192]|nr:MAG: hypothetical protein B7X48_08845 [Acidiphilium sp. 34-60-192]